MTETVVGISDCSVSLPAYAMAAQVVSEAWGSKLPKVSRRVANFDEDALTLAINSLLDTEQDSADALFLTSTTFPYVEKQNAAIAAAALDLPHTCQTFDIANSLRGATAAMMLATDIVRSGSAGRCLVAASDCRPAQPGSPEEAFLGDAGAAVLVSRENIAAEIVATASVSSKFLHTWRRSGDRYSHSGDIRFSERYGYERLCSEALTALLNKSGVQPEKIDKVIIPIPSLRSIRNIFKQFGIDQKSRWYDPLTAKTGFTGTGHPLLLLIAAIEDSEPGEEILLLSYGDGCDAMLLRTTEEVSRLKSAGKVAAALGQYRELTSYTKYLDYRNILGRWDGTPYAFASTVIEDRDEDQLLRLRARRCKNCGMVSTLKLNVCPGCKTRENFDEVKLARSGKIYTFSQEHYFPTPAPPVTMAVIDLDGGGRLLLQLTDCDYRDVKIGMEVRLTFRKMHEAGSYHNYYWKAIPSNK